MPRVLNLADVLTRIWFVVPILANSSLKKKAHKKAMAMLCRIVGIAIIAMSIIRYIISIVSQRG